jgi:hydroxymethylpyrimidine pyrophosphatase-like HAD family hydrolase
MKTLYLSDLDGTLIRSNELISEDTANTINRFVNAG